MSHELSNGRSESSVDLDRPIDPARHTGPRVVLISRSRLCQRRYAIADVGSIPTVSTGSTSCDGARKGLPSRGKDHAGVRRGANEKVPICGSLPTRRSQVGCRTYAFGSHAT
jgi:hypothetical protein